MLSYRHAYHAGNHADVFKHLCLTLILEKLLEKDKPLTYMDSHAAAGLYNLDGDMAQKTQEYAEGIKRLLNASSSLPVGQSYLSLVDTLYRSGRYPGSPAIAAHMLRDKDKLQLIELHNTEFANLHQQFRRDARVSCHHRDGFEGVQALCPPTPRRGMLLIDPPYEQQNEYDRVIQCVKNLHRRWATGTLAIWYPLLGRARNQADGLLARLTSLKPANLFVAELWIKAQSEDYGMHGSGMAVINLPWQVDTQLEQTLPHLATVLGKEHGGYRQQWLIEAR
ncbi:23S rRNA (adenine(2030)-N(6))-methyltransferase RlmJ [Gilvimarinus sp. SDUM040013]|uniref:Ribosomal RNA large subunit methyltransferase J n=1 Tax=Gilvimarinus gilvus TaxID=3058038 RepID=A0ABU4RW67_9GAMM|nr:23S rRNA (adenine(2030)-N(6))-methyltransferase RlmJ [Gilvimarinus sp. SDUM040013]MDO3386541.1 23S rRNA (adenine(2030)-N(6))-methyltransferase RlmJ [Gilvimarinus sp. SDUM040013]MDX6849117.1 23S rRNA (adenine(2030)-N(6))-methyltransferase RlmJ [Gilvimarinus sp. SDUM040013]